ncbi:Transcriptional adapter ada2 [Cryptotrichosporon argae]
MTVTQRRVRTDPAKPDERLAGIKYTCDFCGIDITHTVRIKCAAKECEEVDLCPTCFLAGKEGQRHKAWHDYKVVEQHSYPIFSEDWGADEELLLISGLIMNGLGNWAEAAEHIGTRTKEECEKHYLEVYLGVAKDGRPVRQAEGETRESGKRIREFMPPLDKTFGIDPDEFQARKKARIQEMRRPHAVPAPSSIAPLVSAPTNHEVAGYMPGRLEFEHELDNDAEVAVKDMEFGLVFKYGGDEQPAAKVTRPVEVEGEDEEDEDEEKPDVEAVKEDDVKPDPDEDKPSAKKGKEKSPPKEPVVEIEDEDELEVKLAMLDIYFSKLDRREEAKNVIFDRGLTEYKKIQALERKRPKDEKELIGRYKVFAKLQTAQDFEVLVEGLIYEQQLRRRIAELQEYRRVGITTAAEAEAYDIARAARAGFRPLLPRDQPDIMRSGSRVNAGQHRFLHGVATPPAGDSRQPSRDATPRLPTHAAGRKPATPLNLANSASLDLLSTEEQGLCSTLRLLPKPYLCIKELYIRENERRQGLLRRRDARKMLRIDVNKSGRIFDFLVSSGMLALAYDPAARQPKELNGAESLMHEIRPIGGLLNA